MSRSHAVTDPPAVVHGGTDSGPVPRLDLSTNASPYGPSPAARSAMAADIGPYPDPATTATRATLAQHAGVEPDEVVVGAGATELIDRLVRTLGGPVLTEAITFGEYAGAAARHGAAVRRAPDLDDLLAQMDGAALLLVPSPGNPDGEVRDVATCDAIAERARQTGTTVVWDTAYAPMVPEAVPVPDGAVVLHAPNKTHGCTGLRAGWLTAPAPLARRLRAAEVTWSVSAPGLAFLEASVTGEALTWAAAHAAQARRDRDALVAGLTRLGLRVRHGAAPFALIEAPGDDASAFAAALRDAHGVKIRPTASMGLPGWCRVAAPTPAHLPTLLDSLRQTLHGSPTCDR